MQLKSMTLTFIFVSDEEAFWENQAGHQVEKFQDKVEKKLTYFFL